MIRKSRTRRKLDVAILSPHFAPDDKGGIASHVRYLANALSAAEVQPARPCHVFVVAPGEKCRSGGVRPLTWRRLGGRFGAFPADGAVPYEATLKELLREWRNIRADVVHAHDLPTLHLALCMKAAFGIPVVFTAHRAPKAFDRGQPLRDPRATYLRHVIDASVVDAFVAPSESYRERLILEGAPPTAVTTIPHGIPVIPLRSRSQRPDVLTDLRLAPSEHLILCPARLDRNKGVDVFVEAAALLHSSMPNLRFLIAGGSSNASYAARLGGLIEDLGIPDVLTVREYGPEEMPTLYRRASVTVLPSREEGFGLVILEAFLHRSPVVASNTGGIPELVEPHETGLLCHRDNPEDLAQQIQRMVEDEKLAGLVKDLAYRRLEHDFTDERMAYDYFRLYRDVAGLRIRR